MLNEKSDNLFIELSFAQEEPQTSKDNHKQDRQSHIQHLNCQSVPVYKAAVKCTKADFPGSSFHDASVVVEIIYGIQYKIAVTKGFIEKAIISQWQGFALTSELVSDNITI